MLTFKFRFIKVDCVYYFLIFKGLIFEAVFQVCRDCTLKHTCKFANKPVWRAQEQNLKLSDVMKLITSYDLVSDPPELVVPDEIRDSVSRLLREILKLCTSPSIASMD